MQTDPKLTAKPWQREWLQGLNAVGFVFVIIVLPTAILLTVGLSRPIVLWGSFMAAIITAPLFLIWKERKQHGINMYKLEEKSKTGPINVEEVSPHNSYLVRAKFMSQFIILENFLDELNRLRRQGPPAAEFRSAGEIFYHLRLYDEPELKEIDRIIAIRNQIAHHPKALDATHIEEACLTIERIMIKLIEDSREDVRTAARRAMKLNH